jgi:hypothetical protein
MRTALWLANVRTRLYLRQRRAQPLCNIHRNGKLQCLPRMIITPRHKQLEGGETLLIGLLSPETVNLERADDVICHWRKFSPRRAGP